VLGHMDCGVGGFLVGGRGMAAELVGFGAFEKRGWDCRGWGFVRRMARTAVVVVVVVPCTGHTYPAHDPSGA
jgi:hypothetical protein